MKAHALRMSSRRAAWALLRLAFVLPLLASCSSLLGVDDYHDSASEICNLLGPCFGITDCQRTVSASLTGTTAGVRSEWLRALSDKRCLDSCKAARRCLDLHPLCSDVGESCERKDQCCGFLSGGADCRAKGASQNNDAGTPDASSADAGSSGPTRCCKSEGASCQISSDCCEGSCDQHTGTCGKPCRPAKDTCQDNYECCTKICRDDGSGNSTCSEDVCVELGSVCAIDADCCQGAKCLPAQDNRTRCGFPPECRATDLPCEKGVSGEDCCTVDPNTSQALNCLQVLDPLLSPTGASGVCRPSDNQCFPNDYPCVKDANCCENYCDPQLGRCGTPCKTALASCASGSECCSQSCNANNACDCSNDKCKIDADCCSTNCVGGVCGALCATNPGCDHDECIPGGPLNAAACLVTGAKADSNCVDTVCKADKYCCCVAWDAVCTADAVGSCGKGVGICN